MRLRKFSCWEPGGRAGLVWASTVVDAAKSFLGVDQVQWINGTAPFQGVTYVSWDSRRTCKVWEVRDVGNLEAGPGRRVGIQTR